MRRKLGIFILVGVTVLAGTKEAVRQYDGLRSSLNDLTRASLWSGLIVYAQPVADGQLPSPQIYYLMPRDQHQPASPAARQEAVLADNSSSNNAAAKPEAKNNHFEEAADANRDVLASAVVASREVEDAAKSELVLDRLAERATAAVVAATAPKLERARVYEEVARHDSAARRFRRDSDVVARAFVKEFDAAKIKAATDRFVAAQEQLETLKLKALSDAERVHGQVEHGQLELRVLRRPARPEHIERVKVIGSLKDKLETPLPAISSITCEKTVDTTGKVLPVATPPLPVLAAPAAAATAASMRIVSEPAVDSEVVPVISLRGNSWALDCDTEPEYK